MTMNNIVNYCYSMKELATIIPVGKNSLYKLVKRPDFPKIKVGKRILIPSEGLSKWLAENMQITG